MAFLSMSRDKTKQGRSEFIAWTERYFKAHSAQLYQYRGMDVYAARCALLHTFSAEAELHRSDPSLYVFGYHDGGAHYVKQDHAPKVAMIGTASFFNDLTVAVDDFLSEVEDNSELRAAVESRLPMVYKAIPLDHGTETTA
jgi:pimeloyl-CoA synthetase